jgi:hypothetical protein
MQKPEWLKRLNRADIRAFLKTDRAVLIACMGAALLFWVINRMNQTFRVEYLVPVTYQLTPGMTLKSAPPDMIRVLVSGKGWTLFSNQFRRGDIHLNLPVEGSGKEVIVTSSQIRNRLMLEIGQQVDIINISVDQITLFPDKEIHKEIDLEVHAAIQCNKGFQLSAPIELNHDKIGITGPQQVLDSIDSWNTDTLKVDNASQSEIFSIAVKKHPNRLVHFDFDKVKASVKVEQSTEKRFLVKLTESQIPPGYRIFPDIINVTCNVALSHYQQAGIHDFEIVLNLPENTALKDKGIFTITIRKLNIWTEIVDFNPKSLTYSRL